LVVPDREVAGVDEARFALASKCQNFYYEAGRPSVVALVADEDVPLLAHHGFSPRGRFAEFTFHRSIVRSWSAVYSGLFERVRRPTTRSGAEAQI
jgi:hypothetical protein